MTLLIIGLVLFLGVHSVRTVAPGIRESVIARSGAGAWRGFHTAVSLIGLALIVWGYGEARLVAPLVYEPPVWMKHVNALLMLFALVSLSASLFPAGRIRAALKHPMLLSVKIWAFGHLLANGDAAALLLFGAFLAWAVVERISLKRRGDNGPAPGPVQWDVASVGLGLLLYLLFVWKLHVWLAGVPVF